MVGAERFELPTLCSQSRCATRLRYAPTLVIIAPEIPKFEVSVQGSQMLYANLLFCEDLEELGGFDSLNFDYGYEAQNRYARLKKLHLIDF